MEYFTASQAKTSIKSDKAFSTEDARSDLLVNHYKLIRRAKLSATKAHEIDQIFVDWCDLLFCKFNLVVVGPQSKYSLLETFKKRYLDSGKLPDFRKANAKNIDPASSGRGKTFPMLKIVTVRLHGLDPLKTETFDHAVFGIKESHRARDKDLQDFVKQIESDEIHYVFLMHSVDYLLRDSEDVCDTIFHLYKLKPNYIHLVMSSDTINAGKKMQTLKFSLRLRFCSAPFSESFIWEKMGLMDEFAPDQTIHRLFTDKVDMQSLMDIYQALDPATQHIMIYILKENIERPDKKLNIDFQQLLNHCESNFILRRGAALRDHLGELRDHNMITEDKTGRIKCLVNVGLCKSFLEWASERAHVISC